MKFVLLKYRLRQLVHYLSFRRPPLIINMDDHMVMTAALALPAKWDKLKQAVCTAMMTPEYKSEHRPGYVSSIPPESLEHIPKSWLLGSSPRYWALLACKDICMEMEHKETDSPDHHRKEGSRHFTEEHHGTQTENILYCSIKNQIFVKILEIMPNETEFSDEVYIYYHLESAYMRTRHLHQLAYHTVV
jgi:hypothetical protein